jgi:hypothetical protein
MAALPARLKVSAGCPEILKAYFSAPFNHSHFIIIKLEINKVNYRRRRAPAFTHKEEEKPQTTQTTQTFYSKYPPRPCDLCGLWLKFFMF